MHTSRREFLSLSAGALGALVFPCRGWSAVPNNAPWNYGQWSAPRTWPFIGIHIAVGRDGKVRVWDRDTDSTGNPQVHVWDPVLSANNDTIGENDVFTIVPMTEFNLFCSGHTWMADGNLFIAGGHIADSIGSDKMAIFSSANVWVPLSDRMNAGRWYPTVTLLPDSRLLITSGEMNGEGDLNRIPQIFNPATKTLQTLSTANVELPYYPWMHIGPNGKPVVTGPQRQMRFLNIAGTGTWEAPFAESSIVGERNYGTSVLYEPDRVLTMGGVYPVAVKTAEIINLAARTISPAAPMHYPRRHHNATLMPTGDIFVTGGTTEKNDPAKAVYPTEMWHPYTNTWTEMASVQKPRLYHSTAVPLMDGRVLVTGGNYNTYGIDVYDIEVWTPPYYFWGIPFPRISTIFNTSGVVQSTFKFGAKIRIKVGNVAASRIDAVSMRGLSSATHAFNMHQRFEWLSYRVIDSITIEVQLPYLWDNRPPGYYWLNIISDSWVPSHARSIRLIR